MKNKDVQNIINHLKEAKENPKLKYDAPSRISLDDYYLKKIRNFKKTVKKQNFVTIKQLQKTLKLPLRYQKKVMDFIKRPVHNHHAFFKGQNMYIKEAILHGFYTIDDIFKGNRNIKSYAKAKRLFSNKPAKFAPHIHNTIQIWHVMDDVHPHFKYIKNVNNRKGKYKYDPFHYIDPKKIKPKDIYGKNGQYRKVVSKRNYFRFRKTEYELSQTTKQNLPNDVKNLLQQYKKYSKYELSLKLVNMLYEIKEYQKFIDLLQTHYSHAYNDIKKYCNSRIIDSNLAYTVGQPLSQIKILDSYPLNLAILSRQTINTLIKYRNKLAYALLNKNKHEVNLKSLIHQISKKAVNIIKKDVIDTSTSGQRLKKHYCCVIKRTSQACESHFYYYEKLANQIDYIITDAKDPNIIYNAYSKTRATLHLKFNLTFNPANSSYVTFALCTEKKGIKDPNKAAQIAINVFAAWAAANVISSNYSNPNLEVIDAYVIDKKHLNWDVKHPDKIVSRYTILATCALK